VDDALVVSGLSACAIAVARPIASSTGSCFSLSSRSRSVSPFHERYHVEEEAVGLSRVEERQDVRVLEVRRGLDLDQEALRTDDPASSGAAP
jgi:hypothetical protein